MAGSAPLLWRSFLSITHPMSATGVARSQLMTPPPRLRGRSRFGAAKARKTGDLPSEAGEES